MKGQHGRKGRESRPPGPKEVKKKGSNIPRGNIWDTLGLQIAACTETMLKLPKLPPKLPIAHAQWLVQLLRHAPQNVASFFLTSLPGPLLLQSAHARLSLYWSKCHTDTDNDIVAGDDRYGKSLLTQGGIQHCHCGRRQSIITYAYCHNVVHNRLYHVDCVTRLHLRAISNIFQVNVVVKHVSDYSASREKNDLGFLTFDLNADLNPLFNWNVKQLFLYLSAEYQTPKNEVSHKLFLP